MPNNPIPGINNPVQANAASGVQQTTHGGHEGDHGKDASGHQPRNDRHHADGGVYSGTTDATQSSRDPEGGAPRRSAGSGNDRDRGQQDNPWYADDRIGLVVAGLVVVGVLVVAWAVHRDE